MVNVTLKMHNLQELIRKTYLEGLFNSIVIQFKDNRMKIEAIGIEDEQGIIDNTLTIDINYPTESMTEGGEIAINLLNDDKNPDFLPKLEIFERDDIVQLYVNNNQLVINRVTPMLSLTYDLVDKKFVKTYSTGLKTIFGTPIRLVRLDGKEKLITFDSSVVVDAQKLKDHGAKVSKIGAKSIPLKIKDGKLITELKGETSSLIKEVEGVKLAVGNASSIYDKELLTILKMGIGTAILKLSEGSPLHIHFEHESMSADYLIQVHEEKN